MAKERGHSVVYTAPNHSELQPIETVWAQVKGEVGVQYDVNTTFELTGERLKAAFAHLSSASIDKHIGHSTKLLHQLHSQLQADDLGDVRSSDSSASGSDTNSCTSDDDDEV